MGSPLRSRIDPVDIAVSLALTLALQAEIWAPELFAADDSLTNRPFLSAMSLLISLPLMFRRTFPWTVSVVALSAEVAQSTLASPSDGLANMLAMLLVAYSLGRYTRPPAAYAGILLIAATASFLGTDMADHMFVLLVLGAAWTAGLIVSRRTNDLGELELRRLEATRAGAEEERLRIARELHDVVAHRVSLIVVQSELADTLVDRDPAGARAAIQTVRATGRDALDELRSVLGLLHDDLAATRSPGDTDLARLGALVEDARAGGIRATLEVDGPQRPVPPMVALAAFRIVQEGLTNVVKHAEGSAVLVHLTYRSGAVELSVENDGPSVFGHQPGYGISGMTERASFVGGTLTAAPHATGGFRVAATLPTPKEPS